MRQEVSGYIDRALQTPRLALADYLPDQLPRAAPSEWTEYRAPERGARLHELLNGFFQRALQADDRAFFLGEDIADPYGGAFKIRSEEHTSELQSLMRISYAVFCLQKKTKKHR